MSFKVIINDQLNSPPPSENLPPNNQIVEIKKKNSKKNIFLFFVIGLLLGSISLSGFGIWWFHANRLISPLGQFQQVLGFRDIVKKPSRTVFGYLPYWNFKYASAIPYEQLTHLSLFGVAVTEDGEIQTREADYMEPGYRNITSQTAEEIKQKAKQADIEVSITVTSFDNDIMETVLENDETIKNLSKNIADFVEENDFDGVNVDFEYVGNPPDQLKGQFTKFVSLLNSELKQDNPNAHISVAVYADSAINPRIWDLSQLGKVVDQIIIMAYDFYRPSSTNAGPVAPLFGSPDLWSMDIISLLSKHIELNDSKKIILGVPFYGYEWQTEDETHQSLTIGRGATATHKRISQLLLDNQDVVKNWNDQSLSPWLIYEDEDENIFQIYYEDIQSLSYKYDLTNQANLGGIAIWALGYEDDSFQMWQLIEDKF